VNEGVIHGRFERGFGWMPEPGTLMDQSCTALAFDRQVWLIDPLRMPGIEDELEALGKPAGIVMTIGWHDRDVDWYAARYGIPVYAAAHLRAVLVRSDVRRVVGTVPGTPFQLLDVSGRRMSGFWTESALWWPAEAVLVTGDALGSASYFVPPPDSAGTAGTAGAAGSQLGVHPVRRLWPPIQLRALKPRRVFPGHGRCVESDAARALGRALEDSRKNVLKGWLASGRAAVSRLRGSGGPSR
jgi:hypothetical protein